ncbi:MAG: hypothetical protein Q4F65_12060 [Propionibacteriaceae bacterium]|nr:hypothetical protein [Propionibacteriaceae bacterium]
MTTAFRNKSNVLVGAPDIKAGGGALIGAANPEKASYPTDATTALPAALSMKPAGFISADGVTKTVETNTEEIKDWNGDVVVTLLTDQKTTLRVTFLESANGTVLKAVSPTGAVTVEADLVTVRDTADERPHISIAFEIKGAKDKKIRLFAPDAQVTNVGDVTYVRSGVIQYEAELVCYVDDDGVGLYTFIETIADADADAGEEDPGA